MNQNQAMTIFDEANHLWYYEGYVAKAIQLYEESLRNSNENPLIALQLASALWIVGRQNDAVRCLEIAQRQQHLLGETGKRQLRSLERQFQQETPRLTKDGRSGAELDIERLQQLSPSQRNRSWLGIALSAESIGLHGVALRAYELHDTGSADPELFREEEDVRLQIEQEIQVLRKIRREVLQGKST